MFSDNNRDQLFNSININWFIKTNQTLINPKHISYFEDVINDNIRTVMFYLGDRTEIEYILDDIEKERKFDNMILDYHSII